MTVFIDVVGYLTATLAIVTFLPQVYKTIKTQVTTNISLITYIIYNIANSFFLILGILNLIYPHLRAKTGIGFGITLILAYALTMTATGIVMFIKLKNIKLYNEKIGINKSDESKKEEINYDK